MEFELQPSGAENDEPTGSETAEDSSFSISTQPVIEPREERGHRPADLPRSYGTQTLCLMARDPRTLFAYWDIDWSTAFREETPRARKVFLRVLELDGAVLTSVEVEPMAGNSYITVPDADAAYRGEIGYFNPPTIWNCLAGSDIVTTPADTMSATDDDDFATVPFHLSFQHMIDLLRISKQENASLTSMLAELRAAAKNNDAQLTADERELAEIMESVASQSRIPAPSEFWTPQRIERIFGSGGTSPSEAFGGPNPGGERSPFASNLGGSSRTR